MRTGSAALALLVAAACRHLPPDLEARAVAPPAESRRTAAAADLHGLWLSRSLRGALAEFGRLAVYVFRPDGTYTGAVAGPDECVPLEGRWVLENGVLALDGALELDAAVVGDRLELAGSNAYLELARPGAEACGTPGSPTPSR